MLVVVVILWLLKDYGPEAKGKTQVEVGLLAYSHFNDK